MDRLELVAENFNKNGFKARIFNTGAEAKDAAIELIGGRSVGFGGSCTVRDIGLYEALEQKGNSVAWHWKATLENLNETYEKAANAKVYVSSSNAVLESGALLNIDGRGNRVARLFDGPETVIVIVGENKLAGDYEDAMARAKKYACPPNARRLNMPTPCAEADECLDCTSEKRMCRVTVLLERPTYAVPDVNVFFVRENLGY